MRIPLQSYRTFSLGCWMKYCTALQCRTIYVQCDISNFWHCYMSVWKPIWYHRPNSDTSHQILIPLTKFWHLSPNSDNSTQISMKLCTGIVQNTRCNTSHISCVQESHSTWSLSVLQESQGHRSSTQQSRRSLTGHASPTQQSHRTWESDTAVPQESHRTRESDTVVPHESHRTTRFRHSSPENPTGSCGT